MEKISVLIPAYNNAKTIKETIKSIQEQTFKDYEIVVVDDCSTDDTLEVLYSLKEPRLKIYSNPVNLGCGRNLQKCVSLAENDILFFMCGDDVILHEKTFELIEYGFDINKRAGIMGRNYYWFTTDKNKPIRKREQLKNSEINLVYSFDQISGIALRKSRILNNFSTKPFVEMLSVAYPMYLHGVYHYIPEPVVAIRISEGSTRPEVYKYSPIESWYEIVKDHKEMVDFIARNNVGLIQIKLYAPLSALNREIGWMLKLRKKNWWSIKFWLWVISLYFIPKSLLKGLICLYRKIPKS